MARPARVEGEPFWVTPRMVTGNRKVATISNVSLSTQKTSRARAGFKTATAGGMNVFYSGGVRAK